MRNESNWLEYLRKLANEAANPAVMKRRQDACTVVRTSNHRDEWLQAGYTAQQTLPFHPHR